MTESTTENSNIKVKGNIPISLRAELLGLLCLLLALGVFCAGATKLLTPRRHDYGATWDMYLKEERNSVDVLFLGSSLAYCDIVPAVLYQESGIASYVMAGPEQPMPATYYYLRECCKTQSPSTVFIECTGLVFNWMSDTTRFYKPNLTFMPWSENRLKPTLDYTDGDTLTGLLFPLYAYHGRWIELGPGDLKPQDDDPLAGYTYLEKICPMTEFTERGISSTLEDDPNVYKCNLEFAGKIIDFCQERGIRPVFYITPSVGRIPDTWRERIELDLRGMGMELTDFNESFDSLDLDMSMDFFDSFHLNCRGAEKFSRWLGRRLGDYVTPQVPSDSELWQERIDYFYSKLETTKNAPPSYKNDSTAAKATDSSDDKEG